MSGVHVLENEILRVTVADAGAELISVQDKETGSERIWTADPAVWNRHAPILFPFVGKVTGGKYRIDDTEYLMKTQHGFARDLEFTCLEQTPTSVTHCLTATDRTREIYPFEFRLTVRQSIGAWDPRRLRIEWIVENTENGRMYYSIGGHPGFLMPEGIRKEDCSIVFRGKKELRYIQADAAGFAVTREERLLRLKNGYARYQADIPDTWIFEDRQVDTVGIVGPDHRPLVTLECTQFPMLAVWANRNGSFICLEPWFGRTDDEGFTGSIAEKKGIESLEGGEKKAISYTIEFHRFT